MTPAALHRIAFHGEDDVSFFRIGSALVIAASIPLAIGIAADIAVVFQGNGQQGRCLGRRSRWRSVSCSPSGWDFPFGDEIRQLLIISHRKTDAQNEQ